MHSRLKIKKIYSILFTHVYLAGCTAKKTTLLFSNNQQPGAQNKMHLRKWSSIMSINTVAQSSQELTSQKTHPKVRSWNIKPKCKNPKSYILDSTSLS